MSKDLIERMINDLEGTLVEEIKYLENLKSKYSKHVEMSQFLNNEIEKRKLSFGNIIKELKLELG